MRFLKKLFKIVGYTVLVLLLVFLIMIHVFFQPKSEEDIIESFKDSAIEITIENKEFEEHNFRVYTTQKEIDTTLPNLLFIHGSPGSAMDFERYLKDSLLNLKANLITYDRVGYGIENSGKIQDIAFEADLLNSITDNFDASKTILAGYSYGGPIALASNKKYKKIVLFAPAVYSEVEPMFWFLNFYKFPLTRWMMPKALKTASKEKLQHPDDLKNFEQHWSDNPSPIYVLHGDKDWIVPIENSTYIQQQFDETNFELVVLKDASHDLIWSRYSSIKNELLKVIEE